ncbi:uncharacterized protein LOC143893249 isoform X2 [Temnothorax americanus]|uniref:uncharacterized protein LOC143893249 isoform X2 n=1 Tax=Temnothorax americanus TaxID=1964332 RepID=UPI0040676350
MSDDITERKNNSFEDFYKTDNFEDSELQARLYERIYYDFSIQTDSDIEGDSRITDAPRTIQLDSLTTETNVKSDRLQHESEEQPMASKTAGADSQTMPSTDRTEFTQVNTLAGREMNSSAHGCDNGSPEDLPVTQVMENKEISSKNDKSSKHAKNEHQESSEKDHNNTAYSKYNVVSKCGECVAKQTDKDEDNSDSKYNVVSKCEEWGECVAKQTDKDEDNSDSKYNVVSKCEECGECVAKQTDKDEDNSDSEESMCEVPIPPKLESPLIDLQDSDARTEDVEPSANIDTLSSRINFYILPKEVVDAVVMNIWAVRTKPSLTKVYNVPFIDIIYSYGHFRNKYHQNARMILKNLNNMYFCNRKPIKQLNSLINRRVAAPVFLNTLLEKPIEFEVKIGFTDRRNLQLHLLGMKEYIEELYELLRYWLNLRDDEKDYGIDVTTPPINPIEMYNFLNSRLLQLEKMRFTFYAEHIGGMNDPQWIYSCINDEKIKLVQHEKNTKIYNQSRKKLLQLQTRLLMIANTESKSNNRSNSLVHMFQRMMRKFESHRHLMGERLDASTYLRLILLYNQLFVPHTSVSVQKMLRRIRLEEKRKNKKNSQQIQQEITVRDQGNVVYNVYSSSTASCVPHNINFDNYSAINQQNNEMLVEGQNMNNIALEKSKTTDRNCDEITIYSPTQDSNIIMPLNIEPVSLKDYERNESQLSTSEVRIEPNLFENKRNINVNNMVHIPSLTKKYKKRLKELEIKTNIENSIATAVGLIRNARAFKVPHMTNAADEMERRIRNQTITLKHIKTLSKLVLIEEKYQKEVNVCCKKLRK